MNLRVFVFIALLAAGLSLSLEKAKARRRKKKSKAGKNKSKLTGKTKLKTRAAIYKLERDVCAICLEDFAVQHPDEHLFTRGVVRFRCSHFFHDAACIEPWLAESKSCPTCRAIVREDEIFRFDSFQSMEQAVKSSKKFKEALNGSQSSPFLWCPRIVGCWILLLLDFFCFDLVVCFFGVVFILSVCVMSALFLLLSNSFTVLL